jgi:hypothetical protein
MAFFFFIASAERAAGNEFVFLPREAGKGDHPKRESAKDGGRGI